MLLLQEDEGTKEAKNHQLLTEDIDSILARAEVRAPCASKSLDLRPSFTLPLLMSSQHF